MTLPVILLFAQSVTWREAGPLINRYCNDCHRPGQVGPFDFTTYDGASAYAPEIARYLLAHKMPPWRAKPGTWTFANSRAIPDASTGRLLTWISQGAKPGPSVLQKRHPHYNLGAPDLILSQPKEHTVSGEKTVEIVTFTLSPEELTTTAQDKYLRALDFRPSNRNLLHHAVLHQNNRPLAAWAMTDTHLKLPPGVGWRLAKGQPLTVELHYFKRNLRPARDLTRLALYFAQTKPIREAFLLEATKPTLKIPAGANLHREAAQFLIPETLQLHAVLPIFQLLAHTVRLKPAAQSDWALWIEPFEHHLMSSYILSRPVSLPANSRLDLEAIYDNSPQNEFNPHKTLREVTFAENGLDETFRFWLTVSRPLRAR
jgi:hypothetical protein